MATNFLVWDPRGERFTYFQAQTRCEELGNGETAFMGSVHSEEENDLIMKAMVANNIQRAWIGYRSVSKNHLMDAHWEDGTPNDFNAWAIGEPNSRIGRFFL